MDPVLLCYGLKMSVSNEERRVPEKSTGLPDMSGRLYLHQLAGAEFRFEQLHPSHLLATAVVNEVLARNP
jgi:hypothetical protein